MLRLYCAGGNSVGSTLLIRTVVYEAKNRAKSLGDYVGPRVGKLQPITRRQLRHSRNNVALALGGNGIYYNKEKHDIDAPAFEKDGRTLVPVRAISRPSD